MSQRKNKKVYYHLPGLFEFYELYCAFLPLYKEHREYFYDWCEISSIYGSPADCLCGGGRAGFGSDNPEEVLKLTQEYGISARLTFSNSLLRKEHLTDKKCNILCKMFEEVGEKRNGVIVHSDLLLKYLEINYPKLYFVSSTTKVLTDFNEFLQEVKKEDFRYVVPDFRLNKAFDKLNMLSEQEKNKVEFLCNECCWFGCKDRKQCYEIVSRKNLGEMIPDHKCNSPDAKEGYRFSKAMKNPGFISANDIKKIYLPMGFENFKIEGRGLGSALDDEMGVKKLPKVKELQTEYAKLLEEKKKTYAEYRRSREEMRELLTAKANVDRVLKMEVEQDVEKEKDHGQR